MTGNHVCDAAGHKVGRNLAGPTVDIFRVVNGKLVEYRDVTNRLEFLRQLGVIEYTEKGKQLFLAGAK